MKIYHVGSSLCPPCVESKLAFERLAQLNPENLHYQYISVDPYKKDGVPHAEAMNQLYIEYGFVQPYLTTLSSTEGMEERLTYSIPQFFLEDKTFWQGTWQMLLQTILRGENGISVEVRKTSDEWLKKLNNGSNKEITLTDSDGWDRLNYFYSFYEEKITEKEFNERLIKSIKIIKNDS